MSTTPAVTVVLLNWRRPANIPRVIDSIAGQSVRPHIFLWNNGERLECDAQLRKVDWLVESGRNAGCWPRWFMARRAATEFVATLDDDLAFADGRVLEHLLDGMDCCDSVVGLYGKQLDPALEYRKCRDVHLPEADTPVDVVKGRLMLVRRVLLDGVLAMMEHADDDMCVSAHVGRGEARAHRCRGGFAGRMAELPSANAISNVSGHYQRREELRRRLFAS